MSSFSRPGTFVNQSLTPLTSSPSGVTGGAVACFVGAYNQGPIQPRLITSWQNYVNLYGGFASTGGNPLAYAVWQYFVNGGSACYVYRVPNTNAVVASIVIPSIETAGGPPEPVDATLLTFVANSPGVWANSLYVEIVPTSPTGGDGTVTFTLNIYQGGTGPANLVETWPAVSLDPRSTRSLINLVNGVGKGSNYVTAKVSFTTGAYVAGDGSSDPVGNAGAPAALSGGTDGTTAPSLDTAIISGINSPNGAAIPWAAPGLGSLLNTVLNINIPASPSAPIATGVLNNVIAWAASQGNAFVVIDAPFGGVPLQSSGQLVTSYQSYASSGTVLTGSPIAAVYAPWLAIPDPAASTPNATAWVAPGGAVLGVWSVNDTTHNVAQTPAGTQATVAAAALEAFFTPSDLNALETLQFNPIKQISGSGLCVFGGRTLSSGYPNRYINISRTLLQFTNDFVNITAFAVFQNDDANLWQSISNVLNGYLTQAMQAGMLAGSSPETAFSVVCDATTTSDAQAQAGIVNAQVAVALVSPAEFIIINLSQMQGGGTATVSS